MIDDEQIVERLRRAHSDETVPPIDPAGVLRAARRWRQRRNAARWGGVATACVAVLGVAAGLTGGWPAFLDRSVAPATDEAPAFSATTILDTYAGVPEGVPDPFRSPEDRDATAQETASVDLAAGTVTVSTGGSYSCATVPQAIRGHDSTLEIILDTPGEAQDCTADFRITTYVVAMPAGYAPDEQPTVELVDNRLNDESPAPTASPPVTGTPGCRPALTVCAMNRWLDDMLTAAGHQPLGYEHDAVAGSEYVQVDDQLIGWSAFPLDRAPDRIHMQVQRTNNVGAVVVEHGTDHVGVHPAAAFTCGGFRIELHPDADVPAEVLARTADTVAATISQCPTDLHELVGRYPDLAQP